MFKKIYQYFSNPTKLVFLNAFLIAVIIIANIYFQAFCIPTYWTIILLIICFGNSIFYPVLLKYKRLIPISSFINGISFFVFIYSIIFLGFMNIFGFILILFGVGLITFIPHFFAFQLLRKYIIKPISKTSRLYFLLAFFICISASLFIGYKYHKAIKTFEVFEQNDFKELEPNFLNEKILGMHFIYHTRVNMYDGWRPPKHEPVLVVGMWLNGMKDPLNLTLEKRLELYKKFFPQNQYKFDCSCGMEYSKYYHEDELWK